MLTQAYLENQPNLPFTGHEHSNGARFASGEAKGLSCQRARNKFGEKCDYTDENSVTPSEAGVQETEISSETRKSEILSGNLVGNHEPCSKYYKDERYITWGRSRRQIKSSIFSTTEIAKPLSLGMINPARKPPSKKHMRIVTKKRKR